MVTQIILKSLDKLILELYINFLKKILSKYNKKSFVIQNAPKKIKRITILKSPHVNKKAMEQFEIRIFKANIIFKNFNVNTLLKFLILNKPKSILLKIKKK